MKSVAIGQTNAKLRYLEFDGAGIPLVMLHGLGCASSFEYPHVARAGAVVDQHLLLVDFLGFGFSDQPDGFGYRISDHAATITEFIDMRRFEAVNIYGHSMGGSVAIEVADMLGTRVRNLILSEANLDSGGGMFSRAIAAQGEDAYVGAGHDRTIAEALADGNDAWAATMRRALPKAVFRGAQSLVEGSRPGWRHRLLSHPASKTFIFGSRNLPDPDAETLAAAGIDVLTVSEAGHSMGLENPAGLAGAIATALARNPPDRASASLSP